MGLLASLLGARTLLGPLVFVDQPQLSEEVNFAWLVWDGQLSPSLELTTVKQLWREEIRLHEAT